MSSVSKQRFAQSQQAAFRSESASSITEQRQRAGFEISVSKQRQRAASTVNVYDFSFSEQRQSAA
jgi:hypothetical protein